MRIEDVGSGEPAVTVVGGVHGDEPAGKRAINRLLSQNLEFRKPVRFIIANEKALNRGERFIDTDLNRCFPGDAESDSHEERLASRLLESLKGEVIDIHSTHSHPEAFATLPTENQSEMVEAAGVDKGVVFNHGGTLTHHSEGVVVEAGYQYSDHAVNNAVHSIKNFLRYFNALSGEHERPETSIYRRYERVEGDWMFMKENFQRIEEGEAYARKDGEKLVAEEDFIPVFMSTNGYNGLLGHKAEKIR